MNTIEAIFEDFAETPCRACMFKCPKTKMNDLFNEDQIGNIFTEFTSLQVTELDGLPQHLCQNCYQLCTQFKEFKLKCITSDELFRQEFLRLDKVCKSKNTVNDLNIPDEIITGANEVISSSLPNKSRDKYLETYKKFLKWKEAEGFAIDNNSESVMLMYFNDLSSKKKYKASSLWAVYSMLKTTILRNCNVEIKYPKLISFLKKQSVGFVSQKSEVFEQKDINSFLSDAPDNKYLDCKVVLIFGIYGATRADGLTNVVVNDVKINGEVIIVNIVKPKTDDIHSFTIENEYAAYVKKYITCRPSETLNERFFLNYRNGKCSTNQPIGRNKFLEMPKKIAKFLKLPNADLFSGHSFRRTAAILRDSLANKQKIGGQISSSSTVTKRELNNVNEIEESSLEKIDTNLIDSKKQLSSTSTKPQIEFINLSKFEKIDECEELLHLQIEIKQEQDEKADSFIDTKSTEIFVKNEPEHTIDLSESYDNQSDDHNKPAVNKNENQHSHKKRLDESDSDGYNSDDNFNAYFSDDKKPTKKLTKKKPTKINPTKNKSTKNDMIKFEKFSCDHCDQTFIKKHRMEAHLRAHLGLNPFACDQCNVSFRRWETLVGHKKVKHSSIDEMKMFICQHKDCGKQYPLKEKLRKHLRACHSSRKSERIICELCGKSFANATAAKEHNYTHTGEKPFACSQCPKHFISNYQLQIHLMRHNNIRNHVCSLCGIRKTTIKELKLHMVNYHSKTFHCDKCPAVFNTSRILNNHEQTVHRGIKQQFICTYCSQSFRQARTLKHHIMRHTGEKPHACALCDKRFIQLNALRIHMKVHKPEHGVISIGNPRIKQIFECTYCQQSFSQAKALEHHTMRHTGEKPHACTLCGKRFIQLVALQTHIKVHDKAMMAL